MRDGGRLASVESESAPIRPHFTSLRTRQWLGVRLASLSVPPVAPSLTPRPLELTQRPAYYPDLVTGLMLIRSLLVSLSRLRPRDMSSLASK